MVFFDVFAVIAFRPCHSKEPLLQHRVLAIPQSHGEAEALQIVADTRQAILVPAVGLRAGRLVRRIFPSRAIWTVVLAHGAPGTLAQVWSPPLPRLGIRLQSVTFYRHGY